jgi:hypothetical protein
MLGYSLKGLATALDSCLDTCPTCPQSLFLRMREGHSASWPSALRSLGVGGDTTAVARATVAEPVTSGYSIFALLRPARRPQFRRDTLGKFRLAIPRELPIISTRAGTLAYTGGSVARKHHTPSVWPAVPPVPPGPTKRVSMTPHDPHHQVSPKSRSGREAVFPPYLLTGGKLSRFPKTKPRGRNLEACLVASIEANRLTYLKR